MQEKTLSQQLLESLISIPSYVDEKTDADEEQLGNFIFKFLSRIPWLEVEKQFIDDKNKRFNIFAHDNHPTKLLLYGHMDTITPRGNSVRDQFTPNIEDKKLFGLGSVDMKAGIAVILSVVKGLQPTQGLALLFCCDEEYNFDGMEAFLATNSLKPEFVLSAEPTDLLLGNGCRGVLECEFKVIGSTAHASRPEAGNNAIYGTVDLARRLEKEVEVFTHEQLGSTTVNLAHVVGGLSNENREVTKFANSIPDIAEVLLELRITSNELNGAWLESTLQRLAKGLSLKIEDFKQHFCHGSYWTPEFELSVLVKILENVGITVGFKDPKHSGYAETQMIQEKWGVPTATFGPGPCDLMHKDNEYVNLSDLETCEIVYNLVVTSFCSS